MPVAARDQASVIARWRGGPARRLLLGNFLTRYDAGTARPRLLVDDPLRPRLLAGVHGARITVHGPRREVQRLLRALAGGPRGPIPGWPDKYTREVWAASEHGRPFFRLSQVYASFLDVASQAGLERLVEADEHQPHYLYWVTGQPRFAQLVRHACRLGVGQELHARLVQGIPYDATGEYTRRCLEAGPSFVCEVGTRAGGPVDARTRIPALEPVCWSCTHLGGSMGMIYTPAEHRGQGYGTSLGAFQVDHMLARDGIAWAQIRWNNTASQRIMDKFGAKRTHEPLSRAVYFWPVRTRAGASADAPTRIPA